MSNRQVLGDATFAGMALLYVPEGERLYVTSRSWPEVTARQFAEPERRSDQRVDILHFFRPALVTVQGAKANLITVYKIWHIRSLDTQYELANLEWDLSWAEAIHLEQRLNLAMAETGREPIPITDGEYRKVPLYHDELLVGLADRHDLAWIAKKNSLRDYLLHLGPSKCQSGEYGLLTIESGEPIKQLHLIRFERASRRVTEIVNLYTGISLLELHVDHDGVDHRLQVGLDIPEDCLSPTTRIAI